MPLLEESTSVLRSCEAAMEQLEMLKPALRSLEFVMPDLKLIIMQVSSRKDSFPGQFPFCNGGAHSALR